MEWTKGKGWMEATEGMGDGVGVCMQLMWWFMTCVGFCFQRHFDFYLTGKTCYDSLYQEIIIIAVLKNRYLEQLWQAFKLWMVILRCNKSQFDKAMGSRCRGIMRICVVTRKHWRFNVTEFIIRPARLMPIADAIFLW